MPTSEFCRLCTKYHSSTINIFGELGRKHLLPIKVMNCAKVFMTETDPMTKFICILCIGKLDFVQNFHTECRDAQAYFKRRLAQNVTGEHNQENEIKDKLFGELIKSENFNDVLIEVDEDPTELNNVPNNNENSASKMIEASSHQRVTMSTLSDDVANDVSVKMEVEEECEYGDIDNSFAEGNLYSDNEDINIDFENISGLISVNENNVSDSSGVNYTPNSNVIQNVNNYTNSVMETTFNENDKEIDGILEKDSGCSNIENTFVDTKSILYHNLLRDCETMDCQSPTSIGSKKSDEISDLEYHGDCDGSDTNDKDEEQDDTKIAGTSFIKYTATVDPRKYYEDTDHNEIDSLYCRQNIRSSCNEFQHSFSEYFSLIENVIKRKCSMMPYFVKLIDAKGAEYFGFKCFVCSAPFPATSYSFVIKHLLFHLDLHCFYCKFVARTVTKYKQHYTNNHFIQVTSGNLKCHHCSKTFNDINLYPKHLRTHNHEHCGYCEFKTKSPIELDQHLSKKHKNEKNNCSNCAVFHHDNYTKHFKKIEKYGFICQSCDMVFHNEDYLRVHYKIYGTNHGIIDKFNGVFNSSALSTNTSTCSSEVINLTKKPNNKLCNEKIQKLFLDIKNKKISLQKLKSGEIQIYTKRNKNSLICPVLGCNRSLVMSENNLYHHVLIHLLLNCHKCKKFLQDRNRFEHHSCVKNSQIFECIFCQDKTFKKVEEYLEHVHLHMIRKICEYCAVVLDFSLHAKRAHINKFHKELLIGERCMCELCGKVYPNKDRLKLHVAHVHQGLKVNSRLCPNCGKTYMNKHKHPCLMNVVEKQKFICDYCSKVFHLKANLIKHIRVHMNEKTFECIFCGKKFNRETSLSKHKLDMHSEERRFVCSVQGCTKSFTFKSAFITHLKSTHSVIVK